MKLVVPVCPNCGARAVVPIVYGYPGAALMADSLAGRVALGGCVLHEGSPTRQCGACQHRWGRLREPQPPGWTAR